MEEDDAVKQGAAAMATVAPPEPPAPESGTRSNSSSRGAESGGAPVSLLTPLTWAHNAAVSPVTALCTQQPAPAAQATCVGSLPAFGRETGEGLQPQHASSGLCGVHDMSLAALSPRRDCHVVELQDPMVFESQLPQASPTGGPPPNSPVHDPQIASVRTYSRRPGHRKGRALAADAGVLSTPPPAGGDAGTPTTQQWTPVNRRHSPGEVALHRTATGHDTSSGAHSGTRVAANSSRDGAPTPPPSPGAAAMAKTSAFLTAVRLALQAPLAIRATSGSVAHATAAPTPRRSGRLASQTQNVNVRPSKRGEVLVMKKLGIISREEDT
nr:uncharacterized protein LOC117848198 [Setaria viridis]